MGEIKRRTVAAGSIESLCQGVGQRIMCLRSNANSGGD